MFTHSARRQLALRLAFIGLFASSLPQPANGEDAAQSPSIVYKIQAANQRLEMTVNSSRLLTLDLKIPRAQVNNIHMVIDAPLDCVEQ